MHRHTQEETRLVLLLAAFRATRVQAKRNPVQSAILKTKTATATKQTNSTRPFQLVRFLICFLS